MAIIETKNLTKIFKINQKTGNFFKDAFKPQKIEKIAVDNITFNIQPSELVAFIGPNGAGKTTTTKMLTGLIYPTSGQIQVLGFKPYLKQNEYLKQIGLVMGNKSGLNWDLSANQSLDIIRSIYQISKEDYSKRLDELISILDVKDLLNIQIRKLSLGERMKFELIGSLLHNPKILFLDEPTIGLDIISKQKLRLFIKDLNKNKKTTILLTSHDLDDIETICNRVIIINKGRTVYDGLLKDLTQKFQNEKYIKIIFQNLPDNIENININEEIVAKDKFSITFKTNPSKIATIITKISSITEIEDIEINSIPLERIISEIFIKS